MVSWLNRCWDIHLHRLLAVSVSVALLSLVTLVHVHFNHVQRVCSALDHTSCNLGCSGWNFVSIPQPCTPPLFCRFLMIMKAAGALCIFLIFLPQTSPYFLIMIIENIQLESTNSDVFSQWFKSVIAMMSVLFSSTWMIFWVQVDLLPASYFSSYSFT